MDIKLSFKENSLKLISLFFSMALHFSIFFIVYFSTYSTQESKENVQIEITPTSLAKISNEKNIMQKPIEKPIKPAPVKKAVYGISSNSFIEEKSADTNAAEVKIGNTINKEFDNLKLDKNDEGMIPVDDYLVTEMPKPKKEIRIPYPEKAKQKGLQGLVVMELLINSAGQVANVKLISGPADELNQAAMNAVTQLEFIPAKIKEKSVAVIIRYNYRFQLDN